MKGHSKIFKVGPFLRRR